MSFHLELLLVLLGFSGTWQGTDGQKLSKPVLSGPPEAILKTVAEFFCKVPEDLSVLYELFKEGNLSKPITDYTANSGQPAKFVIQAKLAHDGRFICKARGHNNTEVTPSFSDPMRFKVIERAKAPRITSEPHSDEFWEGESVTLKCSVDSGTYISYDWYLNNSLVKQSYNRSQGQLTIQRLSTSDRGEYSCVASNQFNGSLCSNSTTSKKVRVKEQLSEPEISFRVFENTEGFFAPVVCKLRGTPPVTITLLKNNLTFAEQQGLRAVFLVPIHLNQDMGMVQCQASNGTQIIHSKPLNITVETVEGAVTMKIDQKMEYDFEIVKVWLQCSVERGTFPQYYWFLNNTMLENPGLLDSVFELILTPQTTGIYHCEAANDFKSTMRIRSPKHLISKEVINKLPVMTVAVVFTCFTVLVVAVTACCLYGLVLRRKTTDKYKDPKEDLMQMSYISDKIEYENEYDEEDGNVNEMAEDAYEEDQDVVEASRIEDSDESEEEDENSEDEQEEETGELGEESEKQAEDTKKLEEVPEIQKEETGQQGQEPPKQEEETGEPDDELKEQKEEQTEQEEEPKEQEEETGEQEEEPREQEEEPREQEEKSGEQEEETGEQVEKQKEKLKEQEEKPKEQEESIGEQDEEPPKQEEETGKTDDEPKEQKEEQREQEEEPREQKEEPKEQEEEPKEQEEEPREQVEEPKEQKEETGEQDEEPPKQEEGTGEQEDEPKEQKEEQREQEEEPKEQKEEPKEQEEEPKEQEEEPREQVEEPKEQKDATEEQDEEPKEQKEEPKEQEEEPKEEEEEAIEQGEESREQEEEPGKQEKELGEQEEESGVQKEEPREQEEEPRKQMEEPGEQEEEPGKQEEEPREQEEEPREQKEEPGEEDEEHGVQEEEPRKQEESNGEQEEYTGEQGEEPEEQKEITVN